MRLMGKNPVPVLLGLAFFIVMCVAVAINSFFGSFSGSREELLREDSRKKTLNTGKLQCPLDGALVDRLPQDRPVAVVIDNLPRARPQSGLTKADLVYETLAEGGVTRLLAVYYHGEASSVGPIRSARPYFIELAGGVNAILVHSGGSPEALELLKNSNFPHLDEFRHPRYFWRISQRRPPHNLYSSISNLHKLARDYGLNNEVKVPSFNFISDEVKEYIGEKKSLQSDEVKIHFPRGYEVTYSYDPEEQTYCRFVDEKPHLDAATNSQLSARNIIVQFVKTNVVDGQGRLEMALTDHGRALVFSGKKVIEAVWQKSSADRPTTFKTMDGETVELLPGQSWIEIIPQNTKVSF